jgi:Multidrug resistance efflux pump
MFWCKKIAWPKNFSINKKKIVIILVVIIVLICTVYAFKNNAPKPKQATIDKTVKRTIAETATETGNIEAKYRNNIALDSSQKVIKIAVKEGQLVKKGDLLLELDSSDYQIKLDKVLINLENANLTLNQMLETGIASEKSASENLYSQAKYNLEIAQRKYDDLKKKMNKMRNYLQVEP